MTDALILIPEITKGMKSVGSKSLLEIKKKINILDYQVKSILKIDKNIKITVAIGFEAEKIIPILKQYKNINYIYNPNYHTANQASSIKLYLENYPSISDLLIMSSGILLKDNTIHKNMLTGRSKLFILNKDKENFTLGCSPNKELEYIFYDLPDVWSECVYLNHEAIHNIKNIALKNNIEHMYLFEIINSVLNANVIIEKVTINKKNIMKINHLKDLIKAKLFI